jgi:predicted dehydrogenase
MIRLGLVGCGYWGQKLLRYAVHTDGVTVVRVCDHYASESHSAFEDCPSAVWSDRYEDILDDPSIDGVIIAAPPESHFPLAMTAITRGKHVLVEKPMTTNSIDALRLIEEAERANRVLLVDHTFLFSPAVNELRQIINSKELGNIYYVDSVRAALGRVSKQINVFWDIAIHDLSIIDYMFDEKPIGASATGGHGSFGYMNLFFSSGMIGHVHANWLYPTKTRRMTVAGAGGTVVYDDTEPNRKISRYAADLASLSSGPWNERLWSEAQRIETTSPEISEEEPLSVAAPPPRLHQRARGSPIGRRKGSPADSPSGSCRSLTGAAR